MKELNYVVIGIITTLSGCAQFPVAEQSKEEMQPSNITHLHQDQSVQLPKSTERYIKLSGETLSVSALDVEDFKNDHDINMQGASDLYQAKIILEPKKLYQFVANRQLEIGDSDSAIAYRAISDSLSDEIVLRIPVHQFLIDGSYDNRIVLYGGDDGLNNGPGHRDIDKLVHELNMPIVKIMTHFDDAQGGTFQEILELGSGGMTHAGGYYPGWKNGEAVAIRSDWPSDYGTLDDTNEFYNAHLFAIDYQSATKKKIPDFILVNYHKNFSLWDVFTGLMIPFTKKSQFKDYRDYENNPLEMVDSNSMREMAVTMSTLDSNQIGFTAYCSEGQWNVANLAVNFPIRKGMYDEFDRIISAFQQAPGFTEIDLDKRHKFPEIGWKWLKEQGLITEKQYKGVVVTNRQAVYLDWLDENVVPWAEYKPITDSGLIAKPMSLGMMIRMLVKTHFPREMIAPEITGEIIKKYNSGNARIKTAIEGLIGGKTPLTEGGRRSLELIHLNMVSKMIGFTLQYGEVKDSILDKLGYMHIVEQADKELVDLHYQKYISAILDPQLFNRRDFEKRLDKLDDELSNMQVKMRVYAPDDEDERSAVASKKFFMWAAPQSWYYWLKHPDVFDSFGVKYVATAMHYSQSKDYENNNEK